MRGARGRLAPFGSPASGGRGAGNVLLTENFDCAITDFGLARALDSERAGTFYITMQASSVRHRY